MTIKLYPDRIRGPLRTSLHGVNRGPVDRNWYFDLRPWFSRWQVPTVRTHDCIYNSYDTVDLHYLFPDPKADPTDPKNYRFALTDDLLAAIRDTGAEIYFRLGETIEHQPRMMWNRPERWAPEVLAQVCVHIIRHYNEGWAEGFHWGIKYWEFWNEPNGPRNWTGTPEEFYERYRAVAYAIRAYDSDLKVGLAGYGAGFISQRDPKNPWLAGLKACAQEGVPIDFVSWHAYLQTWREAVNMAERVRDFLDANGLENAESHLGEWGLRLFMETAEGQISIFSARNKKRYDLMKKLAERQKGAEGAALIFGTLVALQDAPVDIAQCYCADTYSLFGLFDAFGVLGRRGMAFDAFCSLFRLEEGSQRVEVVCDDEALIAIAMVEPSGKLYLGVATLGDAATISLQICMPSGERSQWLAQRVRLLDDRHALQEVPLQVDADGRLCLPFSGPSVAMVELVLDRVEGAQRLELEAAVTLNEGMATEVFSR